MNKYKNKNNYEVIPYCVFYINNNNNKIMCNHQNCTKSCVMLELRRKLLDIGTRFYQESILIGYYSGVMTTWRDHTCNVCIHDRDVTRKNINNEILTIDK